MHILCENEALSENNPLRVRDWPVCGPVQSGGGAVAEFHLHVGSKPTYF